MFKVDRKAAAGSFIDIPGTYVVAVHGVEAKISQKGDEVAVVTYKDDITGHTIRDDFYNTVKSHWRVNSLIVATESDLPEGQEIDFEKREVFAKFIADTFIGKTLSIVVVKEEYEKNGEKKSICKVKSLKPIVKAADETGDHLPY